MRIRLSLARFYVNNFVGLFVNYVNVLVCVCLFLRPPFRLAFISWHDENVHPIQPIHMQYDKNQSSCCCTQTHAHDIFGNVPRSKPTDKSHICRIWPEWMGTMVQNPICKWQSYDQRTPITESVTISSFSREKNEHKSDLKSYQWGLQSTYILFLCSVRKNRVQWYAVATNSNHTRLNSK